MRWLYCTIVGDWGSPYSAATTIGTRLRPFAPRRLRAPYLAAARVCCLVAHEHGQGGHLGVYYVEVGVHHLVRGAWGGVDVQWR